ncbi:MAG: CIA30 family protein [Phycisphaeraceae bacterium]
MRRSLSIPNAFIRLLALTLSAGCFSAAAQSKSLADFSDHATSKSWYVVNDGVMGGLSRGAFELTHYHTLVFSGNLSLENNGGFSSIRTKDQNGLLAGYDAVRLRVKGDGRSYYLSLRDKRRAMASSHRFPIKTEAGEWIEVTAPLSSFYYTVFGRTVRDVKLESDDVVSIGITLADKTPGPFRLEIAAVQAFDTSSAEREGEARPASGEARNLFEIADRTGRFKTLLAAAEAVGLLDALKDPENELTLLAPTDAAFAKLPDGAVAELLKPVNRDRLASILSYHVLPERLLLDRTVKTLQGGVLTVKPEGGFQIGDANVIQADIVASNGVIHAIDRVLMPAIPEPTPASRAMRLIELAIDRGVPLYNRGQAEACAAVYEVAISSLLSGYRDVMTDADVDQLKQALATRKGRSADDQAWAMRRALDSAYHNLNSRAK